MSMLGPYASWNKNTGYAVWDNPTAEHVGIFERINVGIKGIIHVGICLLYTSPSPRDVEESRMPSSA